MKKLLLFDIDKTLIVAEPLHDNRFERAISNLHGVETKLEGDSQGYTDLIILSVLLKSEGWGEKQIEEALPELLKEIDTVHAETFSPDSISVLPGVYDLLDAVQAAGHKLGLITGNVESIAKRKLSAVDLWKYFELGGFASDEHTARSDLVSIAIKRAGYTDKIRDVYVFGDTERDIKAAHDAGVVNSVGVTNGFRDKKEFVDAKARYIFDNFKDTKYVLKTLGLSS